MRHQEQRTRDRSARDRTDKDSGRTSYRVPSSDEGDRFGWDGWNADRHGRGASARSHDRARHDDADGGRSIGATLLLVGLAGAAAVAAAPHVRRLLEEQGIGGRDGQSQGENRDVSASITIDRPAAELYRRWRNYERFDQFMPDVIEVRAIDDGQESDWTIRGPGGQELQFRACLTEDQPDRTIAWESDDTPASHSGRVTFTGAGNDRTEVRLELHMQPPMGALGAAVARLLGKASGTDPQMQAERALRNFKRVAERDRSPGSQSGAAWQTEGRSTDNDDEETESQLGGATTGGINGGTSAPFTR